MESKNLREEQQEVEMERERERGVVNVPRGQRLSGMPILKQQGRKLPKSGPGKLIIH